MINKSKLYMYDVHIEEFNQHASVSAAVNFEKDKVAGAQVRTVQDLVAEETKSQTTGNDTKWIPFANSELYDHGTLNTSENLYYMRGYVPKDKEYDSNIVNSDERRYI